MAVAAPPVVTSCFSRRTICRAPIRSRHKLEVFAHTGHGCGTTECSNAAQDSLRNKKPALRNKDSERPLVLRFVLCRMRMRIRLLAFAR